jgi:hypothetical protein
MAIFINTKENNENMAKKRKKIFNLSKPNFSNTKITFGSKSKKKTKHAASDMYDAYKKKFLGIIASFFEQEFGVMAEWIKDILSIRSKLRKLTFYFILLFAGTTVILFGIARYLDCLCTSLTCGASYVLVGLVAIIIALLYRRFF